MSERDSSMTASHSDWSECSSDGIDVAADGRGAATLGAAHGRNGSNMSAHGPGHERELSSEQGRQRARHGDDEVGRPPSLLRAHGLPFHSHPELIDSPALTSMRSSFASESPEIGSRPFSSVGSKRARGEDTARNKVSSTATGFLLLHPSTLTHPTGAAIALWQGSYEREREESGTDRCTSQSGLARRRGPTLRSPA